MSEIQLQAECYQWFHNSLPQHRGRFRRVKNETDNWTRGIDRIKQGVMNKSTGIVAGTWDAFFVCEPIVWIEFKFGTNGLSPAQKEFKAMGEKFEWRFHVVKTLDHFKDIVNLYF